MQVMVELRSGWRRARDIPGSLVRADLVCQWPESLQYVFVVTMLRLGSTGQISRIQKLRTRPQEQSTVMLGV